MKIPRFVNKYTLTTLITIDLLAIVLTVPDIFIYKVNNIQVLIEITVVGLIVHFILKKQSRNLKFRNYILLYLVLFFVLYFVWTDFYRGIEFFKLNIFNN